MASISVFGELPGAEGFIDEFDKEKEKIFNLAKGCWRVSVKPCGKGWVGQVQVLRMMDDDDVLEVGSFNVLDLRVTLRQYLGGCELPYRNAKNEVDGAETVVDLNELVAVIIANEIIKAFRPGRPQADKYTMGGETHDSMQSMGIDAHGNQHNVISHNYESAQNERLRQMFIDKVRLALMPQMGGNGVKGGRPVLVKPSKEGWKYQKIGERSERA
ncbi:hypothetical protein H0H92_004876 [Tricholoma furcatifolium]|nr:hypothetical protein H0H92_004876 [Tricholoma furcatifolium]